MVWSTGVEFARLLVCPTKTDLDFRGFRLVCCFLAAYNAPREAEDLSVSVEPF